MSRVSRARMLRQLAGCTLLLVVAGTSACRPASNRASTASVYTPARETVGAAVNDFFGIRPQAKQPFPFPHSTHVAKKVACTDYCHESVTKGPVAGLPSIKTCMICHESIATDRPLIQQITEMSKRGVDLSWERVYGYSAEVGMLQQGVEVLADRGLDMGEVRIVRFNADNKNAVEQTDVHGNVLGNVAATNPEAMMAPDVLRNPLVTPPASTRAPVPSPTSMNRP